MMSASKLSKNIISNVGGVENINSLTHCVTRLRFVLKEKEKVDKDTIDNLDGVTSSLYSGGQYQVIIGQDVADVFEDIISNYELNGTKKGAADTNQEIGRASCRERV